MNALEALSLEVSLHEVLLLQLILEKIDTQSRREWELSCADRNKSTLNELLDFLEHKSQALETIKGTTSIPENRVKLDRGKQAREEELRSQAQTLLELFAKPTFSEGLSSRDLQTLWSEASYTSTSKPDSRDTTKGFRDYTTDVTAPTMK
ncbi:hypothetical protein ANN_24748 [Periplaneta americana]|uniref:Uncharacterized protein n=1 Tax=Periplaneta americana TaxID=6978 RepID=A0ABQ8RZP7_PERAM|nr:hypothetical protein ANN_24748 [Periplaneta americana]